MISNVPKNRTQILRVLVGILVVLALLGWGIQQWHSVESSARLQAKVAPEAAAHAGIQMRTAAIAASAIAPRVSDRGANAAARLAPTDIGGYLRASLESGTPAEALEAAAQIRSCKGIEGSVEALYQLKSMQLVPKADKAMVTMIEAAQAEQRFCQGMTPELAALRLPLLQKAVDAREPDAAYYHLREIGGAQNLAPAQKPAMVEALRADAERGDLSALLELAIEGGHLELPATDKEAYDAALSEILARDPDGPAATLRSEPGFSSKSTMFVDPAMAAEFAASSKRQAQEFLAAYERLRFRAVPGP